MFPLCTNHNIKQELKLPSKQSEPHNMELNGGFCSAPMPICKDFICIVHILPFLYEKVTNLGYEGDHGLCMHSR